MVKNDTIVPNKYRTHTNGQLTAAHIGQPVRLSGWVHARRDHGRLIFIDLRDKWGITQLTFDPNRNQDTWRTAEKLKNEYVINIEGTVAARPEGMVNSKIPTGEIEIEVKNITILSAAKTLPFSIASPKPVNEELRLKYRFLDLRDPRLQEILLTRDAFITHIRQYLHDHGFVEVQTPILANSSPEGARDFLVPSRLYPGKFYSLPQAPQQFKQLLMVAGLERYFQIAPCFRDEDSRADRHAGDFYQIDLEMSFVEQEDIFQVVEPLMIDLTEKFSHKTIIKKPFPRLSWHEAMTSYGTDKPDLRYELVMRDVSPQVAGSNFAIFSDTLESGGVVFALRVPGGASFTRRDINELTKQATTFGAKGLAYIILKDQPTSPLVKHLGREVTATLIHTVGAQSGDVIFFVSDQWAIVTKALGAVRELTADKLKLKDPDQAAWVWVTDFPMYEVNKETGKIDFSHNPFSMPQGGLSALNAADPTTIIGYQYDLALNGIEISSGAIRNHRPDIMYKAFAVAGYSKKEVDEKFGGMIRAFEYGAPPHGGFAPGLDRLLFALLDTPSIRDIYAFPKDGKFRDLMMGAPSEVTQQQLKELHLKIDIDD